MLLTCPACSTRYDVPISAIPAAGRVVRCSACRAEWLAKPGERGRIGGDRSVPAEALQPVPAPPVAAETAAAALTAPQRPAFPADTREPPASPVVASASPPPSLTARNHTVPAHPQAAMPATGVTPRDLASTIEDEDDTSRNGSGFLAGFASVTVLLLLAVTVYLKHGALAEAVPALAEPLSAYVTVVDRGREELARLVASIKG